MGLAAQSMEQIYKSAKLTSDGLTVIKNAEACSKVILSVNVDMAEKSEAMKAIAKKVYENSENIAARTAQVNQNIQVNLEAVEHMTAASQENSAGVENISEMVDTVDDIVKELNTLLNLE